MEMLCGDVAAPAAAKFADDGGAAGVKPATATACGVDCAEGSAGAAERATTDESGAWSCFHHAQRGPDWQPLVAANAVTITDITTAFALMRITGQHGAEAQNWFATTWRQTVLIEASLRIFGMANP